MRQFKAWSYCCGHFLLHETLTYLARTQMQSKTHTAYIYKQHARMQIEVSKETQETPYNGNTTGHYLPYQ
jgi:hypothetical protein